MNIIEPHAETSSSRMSLDRWNAILDGLQYICVIWLLAVGTWSGPALGATLYYPNGLMAVEAVLAGALIIQGLRGRGHHPRTYPFLWPSLAALALAFLAAMLRVIMRGTAIQDEALCLWQHGEPILRSLLLFLAIISHPKMVRAAWIALLTGFTLQTGAAVLQHFMHVTRWYADLDLGWRTGWSPVHSPVSTPDAPQTAPRVQGLTSYINLTAAMLAASLPFFALPPILRLPRATWSRIVLMVGAFATMAGLWYTNSRGPMFAVFLVSALLLFRLSLWWKISTFAAISGFVLAISSESKRVALAAFLSAIALAAFVKRRHLRYLIPLIVALGLAGGMQAMDAYVLHYKLAWRISEQGIGDIGRTALYHDAIHTAFASPVWGIGDHAVAMRVTHLPVTVLQHLPKTQQNYHNQYLQWAAAQGIPVGIAFTLLVCWAVYWCWRRASIWRDPLARTTALCAASGLAIFLLSCLVDAHFWRIEGGGFFWSILAVTAAAGKVRERHNS